eukprot:CAMPEP_0182471138 /NCGR_PEP_ID=MMETSP1319-20130603/19777_1 /TAXON_ID=172717 /ORGANISM="Bolidomonas pacifica, Strain RCC208" /LENGTH=76 /DNA_ID=CAMNT_0024671657 /DNA_START=1078 /DNA_END=1308 /DNA_ORIENTATION=+
MLPSSSLLCPPSSSSDFSSTFSIVLEPCAVGSGGWSGFEAAVLEGAEGAGRWLLELCDEFLAFWLALGSDEPRGCD